METLGQSVDLFACCIFTLNAFTIVLPAFLVAGALVLMVQVWCRLKGYGKDDGDERMPLFKATANAF